MLISVVLLFAVWSSTFSLGKLALAHSSPLFLTATRMLLAAGLFLGYLAWRHRASFRITLNQFIAISLFGLLGMYLANAFEFWSLQHLSAAKTCFLYSLSPFVTALLSYIHFGEKMNPKKWLGILIGFLGVVPVLAIQTGSEGLTGGLFYLSWPELAMFGAVLCSCYGWILLRTLVKDSSMSSTLSNGLGMLVGGSFALAHSLLVDSWHPFPVSAGGLPSFIQGALLLTLISNIICTNLYGYMLKRYTATFLSIMGQLLFPLFASLNSWFFLNEAPSLVIIFSTGIGVIGLWLFYSAELKQGYIKKQNAESQATSA